MISRTFLLGQEDGDRVGRVLGGEEECLIVAKEPEPPADGQGERSDARVVPAATVPVVEVAKWQNMIPSCAGV